MKSSLRSGRLVKWKDERGFGFIQPVDGTREAYLHISELKDATRRPQLGDTIYYYAATEEGKLRAYDAFILGARSRPSSSPAASKAVYTGKFLIWEVLLLSALPLTGSIYLAQQIHNLLPLIVYPAMRLLSFLLYADDKSRAKRGQWRTPEKTLHLCELAGGWPGGFIAQHKLRHKNRKKTYQNTFWGIVILHQVAWLCWLSLAMLALFNPN